MRIQLPTRLFPILSVWIKVTPSTTKDDYSASACCDHPNKRSNGVRHKFTCRANQVLKFTNHHIYQNVVNMFKCLTTTTTYYGLSIFPLNRRGLNHEHHTLSPLVSFIVAVCSKHVITYNLTSDRKSLDFYWSC